jgi:hypothetical protein
VPVPKDAVPATPAAEDAAKAAEGTESGVRAH